jgi:hypothetical protein
VVLPAGTPDAGPILDLAAVAGSGRCVPLKALHGRDPVALDLARWMVVGEGWSRNRHVFAAALAELMSSHPRPAVAAVHKLDRS